MYITNKAWRITGRAKKPLMIARIVRILCTVLFLFAVIGCLAQNPNQHPGQFAFVYQTVPGVIPTSLTDVIAPCATGVASSLTCLGPGQDAYVCYIDLTGTGQTITVQDKQPSPVAFVSGVLGASGSSSTWFFYPNDDTRCRLMRNGVSWQQTGGTAATGYMVVKHN